MTLIFYLFIRLWPAKIVVKYIFKKSRLRSLFQKLHGKWVSTLFKSEWECLQHIYCSTGRQFSSKKSLLVILKSFRLFVNTTSAVDKCSLPNRDSLMQPIHMQLSQKLNAFSQFFAAFSTSRLNFEHFQKKKMTLIAFLFVRLAPPKIVVRYICKKSRFRLPFQKKHGNRVSTLFKSERQHLRQICCSTGKQFSRKKSLLVIWKSLRLFVNTMSAVDKCSLPNRDNLMQSIHMQLSQKLKHFSEFFSAFSKSRLNLEHFHIKDDAHSIFVSEATACENRG